jgi:hypothetical protein
MEHAGELIHGSLVNLRDAETTPPEIRDFLRDIVIPEDPEGHLIGSLFTILGALFAITGLGRPGGRLYEYMQDKIVKSFRLDPGSVMAAWRRDPAKYAGLLGDLRDLGWSPDRIETLKEITKIIPGVQDLVRMSVREAFSPEIAEKFGQYQDPPTAVYPWAEKLGLSKEWVDRYWAAHWELPGANQGFELLHRGIITEDELKLLLRALDVMPFWRDKLIKLSWNIPTRVDVRRFYDLRTIDEKRLREIYTGMGYHGQDLEDYVLWTKIFVDLPDLITRFKNGWLSLDDLRAAIRKLGLSETQTEELIQTKVKAAASEKLAKDKDLTAAEIIKGVKKVVITQEEGLELLQDLGYDAWEAEFKMAIEVAVETGSPETYAEFKDLTQKFRKATGAEVKPMTEEIKRLGADVVRLSAEVSALERTIKEEQGKLIVDMVLPAEATARVKELQVTLYKAQTELARVRTDYNAKIAEWKHSGV